MIEAAYRSLTKLLFCVDLDHPMYHPSNFSRPKMQNLYGNNFFYLQLRLVHELISHLQKYVTISYNVCGFILTQSFGWQIKQFIHINERIHFVWRHIFAITCSSSCKQQNSCCRQNPEHSNFTANYKSILPLYLFI